VTVDVAGKMTQDTAEEKKAHAKAAMATQWTIRLARYWRSSEFPLRQKAASFTIDQTLQKMNDAVSGARR
jgi:hypothetical protein